MDEKTLTALQGSIKKWEAIVDGSGNDEGASNCPLCVEFKEKYSDEPDWAQDGCYGCPVAERVGDSGCANKEYRAWSAYTWDKRAIGATFGKDNHRKVVDDTSRELAQAELDFLRSLIPQPTAA